jgi:holo-[acyl-carrier protein] synthase
VIVMQVAVGVDIVDVCRMRRRLEDHPLGAGAVFTAHELAYCAAKRDRYPHLAARFAAKEALLKAFGTGLRHGHHWTDIEVRNDQLGRPVLHMSGRLADELAARGGTAEVSLSHTDDYAVAQVSLVFTPVRPAAMPRKERHAGRSPRLGRPRRPRRVRQCQRADLPV